MYFKKISEEENDSFSKKHTKGHLFQSSQWAAVKKCWKADYIGGYDGSGKLVLTCVILIRSFTFLKISMGYIPRGPVCDFTDRELMHEFCKYMHSYCKKNHIAFITLDPDIPVRINSIPQHIGESAVEILEDCGLKLKKINNFEMIQACSVYRIKWDNSNNNTETCEKIYQDFDEKTRYNIKVAQRRGLEIEIYDKSNITNDKIEVFCNLMNQTGCRDNFVPRNKEYFRTILENLDSNVKLFLIKYNPEKDLENVQNEIAKITNQLEKYSVRSDIAAEKLSKKKEKENFSKCAELEKQLMSLNNKCKRIMPYMKDGCIYLSGSILAYWGDKSWYLYGASADCCRDTMPNYLMQWSMIQTGVELGCSMYDLRGVPANPGISNPLYGLYRFKKGFGGKLEEFPGEFFLVNNRLIYRMFCFGFSHFKNVRRFFIHLKNRIHKG